MEVEKIIERIIWANKEIANFWSNSTGWASDSAATLLERSRLDWQVSLSYSLKNWFNNSTISDGNLILAWVNLGALTEGTLKLFLSVFYNDYKSDPLMKKLKLIEPDVLMLEQLKHFFKNKKIIEEKWIDFIDNVQKYRNAIHAFKDKDIGNKIIYTKYLDFYLEFLHVINSSLVYPDEFPSLQIYPQ